MSINFYLTVFPTEALIASQLDPHTFGAYMATGSKKGSAEQIIFISLDREFGAYFDWKYAHKTCVPHHDGEPKHSVYLAIYRVLEHAELDAFGPLYLTTRDGRSLKIDRAQYAPAPPGADDIYLYHELCPIAPVIVSKLDPAGFARYLTDPANKTYVPRIVFTDLKTIDFDNPTNTGHLGSMYDGKVPHLLNCIESLKGRSDKMNKTLDRSHVESFTFQIINTGIYIGDGREILFYRMPSVDKIKETDYDWGRSALII